MAHFAEIDENSKVTRVLVMDSNEHPQDEGHQWLIDNLGGTWVQTSYTGKIRYNFAGIGFTYDPIDDAFIAPIPCEHAELILNDKKQWECSNEAHTL